MTELLFAVGSTNPVKINCVAQAVRQFWPEAQTTGVNTDSQVSDQPMSDEEMFTGARNRAQQALAQTHDATHGVGLEGGVFDAPQGMWAYAWMVVVDRAGRMGIGQSGRFMLPEGVAALVREGLELGEADDRFFGKSNSKQKAGAIGLLSDGRIDRLRLYEQGVTFALLPFVHTEFYALGETD
jgi:inosine/xanthosine triphosphatase